MKWQCHECLEVFDESKITMLEDDYDGHYQDVHYPYCDNCMIEIDKLTKLEESKPKKKGLAALFGVKI